MSENIDQKRRQDIMGALPDAMTPPEMAALFATMIEAYNMQP